MAWVSHTNKIWYLDQDTMSLLGKEGSERYISPLKEAIVTVGGALAISFHHIQELSKIDRPRVTPQGETFLPARLETALAEIPTVRFRAGNSVYDDEFRSQTNRSKPVVAQGVWDWMPENGLSASIGEAVLFMQTRERRAPFHQRLESIIQKNAAYRIKIKERAQTGTETRFKTLEEALVLERQESLQSLQREADVWPSPALLLSKTTVLLERQRLTANFNFEACPLINLYTALQAYQRWKLFNESMDEGDFLDNWHAALGCQYADVFVTGDRALHDRVAAVRSIVNMRAKVYRNIEDATQ